MTFQRTNRSAESGELEVLRGLMTLANQLQSSLDLDAVVHVIAMALSETYGFREASVYLREPGGDLFRVHATVGEHADYDRELFRRPVPRRVWDELLLSEYQTGACYFVDERHHSWTQEQLYYLPPLDLGAREEWEWRANDDLLVPLYDKRRELMGILDLYDPVDRDLPTHELVGSLEVFATHAAVAIENARQYEQLEETKAQLEAQLQLRHRLLDLSAALLSTLDQRQLFTEIATALKAIVDHDALEIRLVDEGSESLYCWYASGEGASDVVGWCSAADEGVSGWVVQHNRAQLVNDMAHDPRAALVPNTPADPQASIIVPLCVGDNVIGVLALDRDGEWKFEEHELEPVRLFGNLAAIAIHNARSYEEIQNQAISDGLTGLHNYRHFQETLRAEVSRAERYGETFCLLMLDLDRFKAVNDTIGHQKGDDVLRSVAQVMRNCSRESDYLARYGGEEFVVILPRTNLDEAKSLAERIRGQVAKVDVGHPDIAVTTSIGIAAYPSTAADSDGVLGAADAALLRAKKLGRDRVCLYEEDFAHAESAADNDLVDLGRAFGAFIGLSGAEIAGLVTALSVQKRGADPSDDLDALAGDGDGEADPQTVRDVAVSALIYGNERWDGQGYPEGRRGNAIPRVARAFAVCRRFDSTSDDIDRFEFLRSRAAKELDPRMVQRFTAMHRGRGSSGG
ncbi:MAG: diguanylate cyclase [Thermoleophilia bacterium]